MLYLILGDPDHRSEQIQPVSHYFTPVAQFKSVILWRDNDIRISHVRHGTNPYSGQVTEIQNTLRIETPVTLGALKIVTLNE